MIANVNGSVPVPSVPGGTPAPAAAPTAPPAHDTFTPGTKDAGAPLPEKDWTILHYCGANNNLASYRLANMNDMEKIGSRDNVNIVSELDVAGLGCKRYYVTQDNDPNTFTSPPVQDMGNTDISDPTSLADFIKFGMKQYPAKHYMLIMASHGLAWEGLQLGNYSQDMSVEAVRQGIEQGEKDSGHKLDVLAFDACLMGSAEAAYELKDTAHYMVASEQVEGFNAWRYAPILQKAFVDTPAITPQELGETVVDQGATVKQDALTMGCIDLTKMDGVKQSVTDLAHQILQTPTPMKTLRGLAQSSQAFYWPVRDLYDFAQRIATCDTIKDDKLTQAAKDVMASVSAAVVKEEHSTAVPPDNLITDSDILGMDDQERAALYDLNGAHGLNVELRSHPSEYGQLQFARDIPEWTQAVDRIRGRSTAPETLSKTFFHDPNLLAALQINPQINPS